MDALDTWVFGSGLSAADSSLHQYLKDHGFNYYVVGDQLSCKREEHDKALELLHAYDKENPFDPENPLKNIGDGKCKPDKIYKGNPDDADVGVMIGEEYIRVLR